MTIKPPDERRPAERHRSLLGIDETTELEPDIAVARGQARDYKAAHPSTAALVIEVAETSLEYDRTTKARLCAMAGVPDYWIVDLIHRRLEIRRQPSGDEYGVISIHRAGEVVQPVAFARVRVAAKSLLP